MRNTWEVGHGRVDGHIGFYVAVKRQTRMSGVWDTLCNWACMLPPNRLAQWLGNRSEAGIIRILDRPISRVLAYRLLSDTPEGLEFFHTMTKIEDELYREEKNPWKSIELS